MQPITSNLCEWPYAPYKSIDLVDDNATKLTANDSLAFVFLFFALGRSTEFDRISAITTTEYATFDVINFIFQRFEIQKWKIRTRQKKQQRWRLPIETNQAHLTKWAVICSQVHFHSPSKTHWIAFASFYFSFKFCAMENAVNILYLL